MSVTVPTEGTPLNKGDAVRAREPSPKGTWAKARAGTVVRKNKRSVRVCFNRAPIPELVEETIPLHRVATLEEHARFCRQEAEGVPSHHIRPAPQPYRSSVLSWQRNQRPERRDIDTEFRKNATRGYCSRCDVVWDWGPMKEHIGFTWCPSCGLSLDSCSGMERAYETVVKGIDYIPTLAKVGTEPAKEHLYRSGT